MNPSTNRFAGGMMANSVTHTPRTSGVGSALAFSTLSSINKPGSMSNNTNKILNNILIQSPNQSNTLEDNAGVHGLNINISKAASSQPTSARDVERFLFQ